MIDKFTAILLLSAASVVEAQEPFQVISKISATTIAGRPVQLDADGKLLPWPMPDDTGYSYSSHFLRSGVFFGISTIGTATIMFR